MEIKFSPLPKSNAHAKALIAEYMTNSVAAAEIEEFNLEFDCDGDPIEDTCEPGDALDDFIKLIGCGSDYLRSLRRVT